MSKQGAPLFVLIEMYDPSILLMLSQTNNKLALWSILNHRKSKTKLNQIRFCVLCPSKENTGKAEPMGMGSEGWDGEGIHRILLWRAKNTAQAATTKCTNRFSSKFYFAVCKIYFQKLLLSLLF